MLRAEQVDAFLSSAFTVLAGDAAEQPHRGSPMLRQGETFSSREVTVLMMLEGDLTGVVFYSMSLATAMKLRDAHSAGQHSGAEDAPTLASDGATKTAQLIADQALERLRGLGCACTAADFVLIAGFGERLTEASPVLIVPLFTRFGDVDVGIAIAQADACVRREAGTGDAPSEAVA